jgi:hypothetical protein
MGVMRAGLAIQEALRLAEDDPSPNAQRLAEVIRKLEPVARRLVDIPLPPQLAEDAELEPGPSRTLTCPRCRLGRIVTALSSPACPRCGEDGKPRHL